LQTINGNAPILKVENLYNKEGLKEMKVLLDVDRKFEELTITIQCKEMDHSIKEILDFLNEKEMEFIVGRKGDKQHILKPDEIHCFQSEGDTVVAVTNHGIFKIKEKLYELEQFLPSNRFIRLSKSVIANLHELSHFEASFNGTLCVYFKSGKKEYMSRHYVGKLKEVLKMNRRKNK
jgi:DNA-binding LytR/AlgR family response regulator